MPLRVPDVGVSIVLIRGLRCGSQLPDLVHGGVELLSLPLVGLTQLAQLCLRLRQGTGQLPTR
jgi:hypothetical protein